MLYTSVDSTKSHAYFNNTKLCIIKINLQYLYCIFYPFVCRIHCIIHTRKIYTTSLIHNSFGIMKF